MPISDAKKAANKRWNEANVKLRYDRIETLVPKGEKDNIKNHAIAHGESLNGFINRAIENQIKRDNETPPGSV